MNSRYPALYTAFSWRRPWSMIQQHQLSGAYPPRPITGSQSYDRFVCGPCYAVNSTLHPSYHEPRITAPMRPAHCVLTDSRGRGYRGRERRLWGLPFLGHRLECGRLSPSCIGGTAPGGSDCRESRRPCRAARCDPPSDRPSPHTRYTTDDRHAPTREGSTSIEAASDSSTAYRMTLPTEDREFVQVQRAVHNAEYGRVLLEDVRDLGCQIDCTGQCGQRQ